MVLFVIFSITLHRFIDRMNNAEERPLSIEQAIRATSIFVIDRKIRARRTMIWRHGKIFMIFSMAFQGILMLWGAIFMFFVALRAVSTG